MLYINKAILREKMLVNDYNPRLRKMSKLRCFKIYGLLQQKVLKKVKIS